MDWSTHIDIADYDDFVNDEVAFQAMRTDGWELDPDKFSEDANYPGLYEGEFGPTSSMMAESELPLGLFFFFMPRSLWMKISKESNRYCDQKLSDRAKCKFENQTADNPRTLQQIYELVAKKSRVEPHELLRCIGLLLARMLSPQRRNFADHWATASIGAVPTATFGWYMVRNRFAHIIQHLHFTNNAHPKSFTYRAWKVRSVLDTLQKRFAAGYKVPPVLAFDEAIIPSRSRYNPTRQYLKGKPHKWGGQAFYDVLHEDCLLPTVGAGILPVHDVRSMLYMPTCSLDVFCGKQQHIDEIDDDEATADNKSGPAAVARNLKAVLPPQQDGVFHAVITDRFYTSVQGAIQLLARGVYTLGTILANKAGYCTEIKEKNRSRPASIPRGTTRFAVNKAVPAVTAAVWWDNKPVQFLSTGGGREMVTCRGDKVTVPCPSMIRDYHRWMRGVDVHDQLRLQRFSLQLAVTFRKYYKTVFLGLVDMALVNAFIVFREAQDQRGEKRTDHSTFLKLPQYQMLDLTAADFAPDVRAHWRVDHAATNYCVVLQVPNQGTPTPVRSAPPVVPREHQLQDCPEMQKIGEVVRHRQHQCKVCSVRTSKVGERVTTKCYCPASTRVKSSCPRAPDDNAAGSEGVANDAQGSGDQRHQDGRPRTRRRLIAHDQCDVASTQRNGGGEGLESAGGVDEASNSQEPAAESTNTAASQPTSNEIQPSAEIAETATV
ncbi:unnamed protein product [Phytophthora fragariaefolia]|uniref:Unnamed protein product n=1 Tax=Phytophthora fragariaefolia TaxID=1490495 RepID=A0A9W7CJP3_9STRA|nr:unnamed protein product [Phytophthora fragariaefolia]